MPIFLKALLVYLLTYKFEILDPEIVGGRLKIYFMKSTPKLFQCTWSGWHFEKSWVIVGRGGKEEKILPSKKIKLVYVNI